jgi:hypothetical protein
MLTSLCVWHLQLQPDSGEADLSGHCRCHSPPACRPHAPLTRRFRCPSDPSCPCRAHTAGSLRASPSSKSAQGAGGEHPRLSRFRAHSPKKKPGRCRAKSRHHACGRLLAAANEFAQFVRELRVGLECRGHCRCAARRQGKWIDG